MKKLIMSGLILATIGIVIISCKKEKIISNEVIELSNTKEQVSDFEILTDEQLLFIGEYHNESLESVFSNFDWRTDSLKDELSNNFISNNIELNDYSNEYLLSRCINDYDTNYMILQSELSILALNIVDEAILLSKDIISINSYNEQVDILKFDARNTIEDNIELNSVLLTLEVLKYSAYFWSPIEVGGQGIGFEYINSFDNEDRTGPKDVLAADGISAGIGMIGLGIGAGIFGGPIGWGALAVVGGEAALSSAASLLF